MKRKKKRVLRFIAAALLFALAYASWILATTPNASKIKECIVTKQYEVHLCPQSKNYVRLQNVSPAFRNLVLIAEDSAFYVHHGIDWDELKNSLQTNFDEKKFARGGSTITQQLAKNVFLPFDKSISRKIREALLAIEIEKILSKNEILERYLNVIEFAPKIYGVDQAAAHFFNKSPRDLNMLEAAYLVYLIPNPKVHSRSYASGRLTPYARYRILDLTYRLYRYNKLTHDQYLAAKEHVDQFPWTGLGDEQMLGPASSGAALATGVNSNVDSQNLAPETADAPTVVEIEAEAPIVEDTETPTPGEPPTSRTKETPAQDHTPNDSPFDNP